MSSEAREVRDAAASYDLKAKQEVPAGYKQTEVGVIPEDWDVLPLGGTLLRTHLGGNYPNQDTEASRALIKMGNIGRGNIDVSQLEYVPDNVTVNPEDHLKQGDVLLNTRNTLELVGKVAIWRGELSDAYFNSNLLRLDISINKICDSRFLNYALNSESSISRIRSLATGTTSVAAIYTRDLLGLSIIVPPKQEQRAIATALSDVDALITALDKLIAKKRAIKTATMQQLLTGKTRLPGFSGEWETKRLGDVCRLTTGRKDVNEGNPTGQYPFFTCSRTHTYSDSYSFDTEAILVAGNGDVGNLNYFSGKFEAYQRTYVLYEFAVNVRYLWNQLDAFLMPSLGVGKIGTSIPYIKMENLQNFEFDLPKREEEQTAIAQVLSDMDAEIAALEARRDKTRAIKQGMMQQLLTGRVRLVKPHGKEAA